MCCTLCDLHLTTLDANLLLNYGSLFLSLLVLSIIQGKKMHLMNAERSQYVLNIIHYYSPAVFQYTERKGQSLLL